VLADGLGPDDEPLLEDALDDRAPSVRAAAADLLARLPGSALAGRMADRARVCVRLERRQARPRIAVTPPAEYDQGLARDGVERKPAIRGYGQRGWWLRQVVAATPLGTWVPAFATTAAGVVALPVDDDWAAVLRAGWADAAVRQRAADWAAALLPHSDPVAAARLLALLPERSRVLALAARVHRADTAEAAALVPLLAAGTGPWPPAVAEAVVALLDRIGDKTHPWSLRDLLRLAEHRLPFDTPEAVERAWARRPEDAAWRPALRSVADTVTFRRTLFEELP
jgi:hypothetical protein